MGLVERDCAAVYNARGGLDVPSSVGSLRERNDRVRGR